MEQVKSFLDLPISTLSILAVGYVGYRLAYVGRDKPHKSADTVFLALVWAAIARAVSVAVFAQNPDVGPFTAYGIAAATALVLALVWRWGGQEAMFQLLRWLDLIDHDGQISAWDSLLARSKEKYSRLVVKRKDGSAVLCDALDDFCELPMGPCLLGADGSIGLYVTDIMHVDSDEWTPKQPVDTEHPGFAYTMTFIPAHEISSVEITFAK